MRNRDTSARRRHAGRTAVAVAGVWCLIGPAAGRAAAQSGASDAVPVAIVAEPDAVWARGTVLLRGTVTGTVPLSGVRMQVLIPAGATSTAHVVEVAPSLAPDGTFEARFSRTEVAGNYEITLSMPNARRATGSFKVIGTVRGSPPAPEPLPELVGIAGEVVENARKQVSLVPPSPAKSVPGITISPSWSTHLLGSSPRAPRSAVRQYTRHAAPATSTPARCAILRLPPSHLLISLYPSKVKW